MLTQILPGTDGFYLRRANSKLCFLLHKILYAAKNASPEWGGIFSEVEYVKPVFN